MFPLLVEKEIWGLFRIITQKHPKRNKPRKPAVTHAVMFSSHFLRLLLFLSAAQQSPQHKPQAPPPSTETTDSVFSCAVRFQIADTDHLLSQPATGLGHIWPTREEATLSTSQAGRRLAYVHTPWRLCWSLSLRKHQIFTGRERKAYYRTKQEKNGIKGVSLLYLMKKRLIYPIAFSEAKRN